MSMRLVSLCEEYPFEIPFVTYYQVTVATPRTALAKMYEEKNELLVTIKIAKAQYQDPEIHKLLKWGSARVQDKNYYRDFKRLRIE